jgi:ACS family hexuronate transporter-like MFS transporter
VPGIALIVATLNWRWVFFLSGAAGLLWTLWWMRTYYTPAWAAAAMEERIPWLRLFTYREVWGLVIAKFLSDAAWYFYLFWLPKYLYDVRGFDTKQVGYFAWIPYAASGIGSLCGGWFSGRLIRGGYSLNASRKIALAASAGVMPLIFFVTQAPVELAILLFSIALPAIVVHTGDMLPADLFPRKAVGSVAVWSDSAGRWAGWYRPRGGISVDHGFGYRTVFGMVRRCTWRHSE